MPPVWCAQQCQKIVYGLLRNVMTFLLDRTVGLYWRQLMGKPGGLVRLSLKPDGILNRLAANGWEIWSRMGVI